MRKWIFLALALVILIPAMVLVYLAQTTRQLTGVVRDSINQQPIQDALINLNGNLAASDANGEYSITLFPGATRLGAEADRYVPAQLEFDASNPLSRTVTFDVWLMPNQVGGVVRDAETNIPLPNAQVMVGEQKILTNAQGAFQAQGIKKNTPITVTVPGYQAMTQVFDGQGALDIPLTPSTVVVTVSDVGTKKPLANVRVQFDTQSLTTGLDGRVELRRIKPGTTIRVSLPGYDGVSAPFLGGELIGFGLRANVVEGIVTDATTNQPLGGTLVMMGAITTTTNAQGKYRLENVPPKATIALLAPGYRKTPADVSGLARRDIKLAPFQARGIRVPFGATNDHVNELVDMVTKTELNTLVVDVKSEKGRIAWDSRVPLAKEIGARLSVSVDVVVVLEACRQHNIYCIARMPVFQDTLLATSRPNLAIRYPNGVLFTEAGGATAWTNPFNQDVWNYNLALAKEVVAMGFEEIQFDYVRFPGAWPNLAYAAVDTEDTRLGAITGFLARAQKELRPTGVFLSADVFGLTTATDDEQRIGQRLRDLGPYLDYISPMVYPDTWVRAEDLLTRGLGISNCTEAVRCPYEVIFNSTKRAMEKTPTRIRPWLQAYVGRGDYGVPQYRIQKKAATEAGSHGWLFWNGTGNYDIKLFDAKK